ncbi:Fe-S protein [Oleiphilus messinensis]|uniref:Fe-S protein n=1 Tax=Oleiphilus messinensis TaxID=141451 RepID=A0A1Y0IAW6_9GAMM|nr:MOSC N-terminal beta barrel domain-containing protein [Oleiphilus messinensis]ARU56564.1 Fe-S protein [Oleiphilus messinensis]
MQVTGLNRFPVKSLAAIESEAVEIDSFGVKGDRRWMMVDEQGKFITQRQKPELSLISVNEVGHEIQITLPGGMRSVTLSPEEVAVSERVTVWSDQVNALVYQGDANHILSDYLDAPVRFVYMPETTFRQVDRTYFAADQRVSFADGFPLLLLNEASLAELNGRLSTPVPISRFRGNIIIDGVEAFEEDGWKSIQIGDLQFDLVKPCSRCVMTTVDSSTGKKGREPLMTLSTYRKNDYGICFGQNMVQRGTGVIRLGDRVEVFT